MQKWEYLVISYFEGKYWANCNYAEAKTGDMLCVFALMQEMGQQGWEMVTAADAQFFFKRPLN